jgi:hypothetical protein
VRHREYEPGRFINDVEVDGKVWTVALSAELLEKFLPAITRQVEARPRQAHIGYGCWGPKPTRCRNNYAAPALYEALQNLIADWERVTATKIPDDHEAKAALALAEGRAS